MCFTITVPFCQQLQHWPSWCLVLSSFCSCVPCAVSLRSSFSHTDHAKGKKENIITIAAPYYQHADRQLSKCRQVNHERSIRIYFNTAGPWTNYTQRFAVLLITNYRSLIYNYFKSLLINASQLMKRLPSDNDLIYDWKLNDQKPENVWNGQRRTWEAAVIFP